MKSVCLRCALRLQRAVQADTRPLAKRTFSGSTTRQKHHGVPVFQQSSSPELDDVLTSIRNKYFIPGYLQKSERELIFGTKHKVYLEDHPQTVTIGEEDIQLQWIDRRREIPNRTRILHKAIDLMANGEGKDWQNLPALLTGLTKLKSTPKEEAMERIVRKACSAGRLGVILRCLQQAHDTGMTLKQDEVLRNVVWGLHDMAQIGSWSEEATKKALKDAYQIALLLEEELHGGGRLFALNDARRRPEVLGVFLELAAVYAYKYQDAQDLDGKVNAYAERLLSNISAGEMQLQSHAPPTVGPVYAMLYGVPLWHGLSLTMRMLGDGMPHVDKARKIVQNYEADLTILAQTIQEKKPKEGTYRDQALRVWRGCIRG